jgi:hypothetical protein
MGRFAPWSLGQHLALEPCVLEQMSVSSQKPLAAPRQSDKNFNLALDFPCFHVIFSPCLPRFSGRIL